MNEDDLRRVFSGDSEMASRMRGYDWSSTPIGSPDGWPATLKSAIALCLRSRVAMCVVWGPDRTLFYNDAGAKLLGPKDHPSAFARSGLSTELWSQIADPVGRVTSERQSVSLSEVSLDDQHVAIDLVPIYGDGDAIDGVVVEMHEGEQTAEMRAKGDFLSLFGHELRNPLSTLSTTLQVLLRQSPSIEVSLMDRSLRHLTRLVDDLLDLSRLRRGRLELRRTKIELAFVVDLALERLAQLLRDRKQQVFVNVPRNGLGVDCDPERMAQAISNVLHNAAKYSDTGAKITITGERSGDRVHLDITDEGAGIEPSRLVSVFEPFRDGADRPPNSGLGLGLAIARSLIERHDGTIELHSAGAGQGTRVTIDLPFTEVTTSESRPAPHDKPRKRVLLVDDNHDTAIALQRALETLGYQVALAHNGPVALTVAKSFLPDVALLDINLPVMDGWELSRRLRELKIPARELQFVAVTARDQETDKLKSAESGFVDHLVKPIDLAKLEHAIEGTDPQ